MSAIRTSIRWLAFATLATVWAARVGLCANEPTVPYWLQQYHGHPTVRFLSLEHVKVEDRRRWHNALMFQVSSASRSVSLEHHLPRRLPPDTAAPRSAPRRSSASEGGRNDSQNCGGGSWTARCS